MLAASTEACTCDWYVDLDWSSQGRTGTVRIDDRPVTAPGPDRGVMFQDYALFPWQTVWGNAFLRPVRPKIRPKSRMAP